MGNGRSKDRESKVMDECNQCGSMGDGRIRGLGVGGSRFFSSSTSALSFFSLAVASAAMPNAMTPKVNPTSAKVSIVLMLVKVDSDSFVLRWCD